MREAEPFAAVILCTADHRDRVDERTRSKWSRVLRYAAEFKEVDEPLRDFVKRKGGINVCAERYARRLGRVARIERRSHRFDLDQPPAHSLALSAAMRREYTLGERPAGAVLHDEASFGLFGFQKAAPGCGNP